MYMPRYLTVSHQTSSDLSKAVLERVLMSSPWPC